MPLGRVVQQDFAAGMVRSVAPHVIPENGVYDALNALTDEDGSLQRRGGSEFLTPPAFGTGGLRFLWEGWLAAGKRTVVANTSDFGVVNAAGDAFVNLGGSGLSEPARGTALDGVLFIGGGTIYAGSRMVANYSTGTVTATNGSKTVTGSGTTWNTLVDAGMFFRVGSERYYVVESVDSTTQITLRDAYQGSTGAGKAYVLSPLGTAPKVSGGYATVADRLISWTGNRIDFSAAGDWTSFAADDYHELPGGSQVLGAHRVRDSLLVFATNGVWVLGNLAYDLTDAFGNVQHRLEHANPELVLWHAEGIATWQNSLVVPSMDGVWLLDAVSSPTRVSDSVSTFLQDYVRAGYRPGLATVYRDHYLLPILSSTEVVDLLVCRLNRPTDSRVGTVFPWTRFDGHGATLAGVARRVDDSTREPELIGAHRDDGRLLTLDYFEPGQDTAADADGSAHVWQVISRDSATGPLTENLVKRLRVRYLMEDPGGGPTIGAAYSLGRRVEGATEWGLFDWGEADWTDPDVAEWVGLDGDAPDDIDATEPYVWWVNKRERFFRVRLQSSGAAGKLALRSIELYIRGSGKDR